MLRAPCCHPNVRRSSAGALTDLLLQDTVAGKTRAMEDEFISASGADVRDAFNRYLRPLLGSGMPDAFRLRHNPVAKVLVAPK